MCFKCSDDTIPSQGILDQYQWTGMACQGTWTPLSPGPMEKPTFSRDQNTGGSQPLASWTVATPSRWTRASVGSRQMWTQRWFGPRMIRSTFSKDPNTGSLTLTGVIIIIIITRPRPAFGRLGLGGSLGGYSNQEYTSHASPRACGARLVQIVQELVEICKNSNVRTFSKTSGKRRNDETP